MFYAYHTDAGSFVLERQPFTESAWQFVFNGRFIDSYVEPAAAARAIVALGSELSVSDAVLLPPAHLEGWEIHWSGREDQDAAELWLHYQYLRGQRPAHSLRPR
jgi:hypothetical protein